MHMCFLNKYIVVDKYNFPGVKCLQVSSAGTAPPSAPEVELTQHVPAALQLPVRPVFVSCGCEVMARSASWSPTPIQVSQSSSPTPSLLRSLAAPGFQRKPALPGFNTVLLLIKLTSANTLPKNGCCVCSCWHSRAPAGYWRHHYAHNVCKGEFFSVKLMVIY